MHNNGGLVTSFVDFLWSKKKTILKLSCIKWSKLEIDTQLWTLVVATVGAIASILFIIVELYVRVYSPRTETKRLGEKEALESLKSEYERCAWSIENNIEKYVEKNELTNFKAQLSESWIVGKAKISDESIRQVQEYNEKLELYDVLCRASKTQIKSIVEKRVKERFPNTLKKRVQLDKLLQSDFLMARYFDGEKVTDSWLKEEHPTRLKEIIKGLDESEKDELDTLFRELNNGIKRDIILQRCRKEKKGLIKHGQETIKALQREIESLEKKLKKYSYLRASKTIEMTPEY